MPAMPRPKGKAKKIAYSILGKPENLKKVRLSEKERLIERRLAFNEVNRLK